VIDVIWRRDGVANTPKKAADFAGEIDDVLSGTLPSRVDVVNSANHHANTPIR
jgi:hypothetical protein